MIKLRGPIFEMGPRSRMFFSSNNNLQINACIKGDLNYVINSGTQTIEAIALGIDINTYAELYHIVFDIPA